MSNPILDLSIAMTIASVAVFGAVVLPKPKPEPPPPPPAEYVCDPEKEMCLVPAKRAEPMTDAQRLEQLNKKVETVAEEQRRLIEEVKQLTSEVRK